MPNIDVIQRLADAWNPPDVTGKVYLVDGQAPDTVHICFSGRREGRSITVTGAAMPREMVTRPEHRKALARNVRDYLASMLSDIPQVNRC
ncbi:MAG: hypothetical protein EOP84_25890 [Verrucomicrobiaceae bacterium]|nr:MAG: hypothetical protein EOP84_25890 [Verrucomicrobiaceae bacterium]